MKIVAEQPLSEIVLRKYELPSKMKERELVKKLCLSIGLLQPGDSRDVVVDVFHSLLCSKIPLSAKEVESAVVALRQNGQLSLKGVASSNIRRQLKRLKSLFFVERV